MNQITKSKVSIIIPVYSDWSSLSKCIKSLKKHTNPEFHKILLVNDCGPEADKLEKKILRRVKKNKNFHYYRNSKNTGFVKTCNRAVFELDESKNDILLLNSDTKVTKGFLEEMTKVLNSSGKIAAVCPRSNNATVFSVPMKRKGEAYSMRQSYGIYKKIKDKLPEKYISPVAHGFCMLIKRSVIDKYGLFDEIYGKGYGEENDFCMRVRKHGYKCAVANYAFVFHYHARSFSEEKKSKLIKENEKILTKRYPDYYKLVREYIESIEEPNAWALTFLLSQALSSLLN